MNLRSLTRRLFSRPVRPLRPRTISKPLGSPLEALEDRSVPATLTDGGPFLTITLDNAGEELALVSNGGSYSLTGTVNFVNGGVASPGTDFTAFGQPNIDITAAGVARYSVISIVDSASGTKVSFLDSGLNAYSDNFQVTLEDLVDAPIGIEFVGASTFAFGITARTSGTLTMAGGSSIQTGQNVTMQADRMDLGGTIGAFGLLLAPAGATRGIDLGSITDTADALEISDAELDGITLSQPLIIGAGGTIDITAAISPALVNSLILQSAAGITQAAAGSITETNLLILSDGAVSLDGVNNVTNLAARRATGAGTGDFAFNNGANPLAITTTALATSGITWSDANVTVIGNVLEVVSPINAGNTATGGIVTIQPFTSGLGVDLGTETPGDLSLTNTELGLITARILRIGEATAGTVAVSADVALVGTGTLRLTSASTITATAGGVVVPNLALDAGGAVNFTDTTTDVDFLAVRTSNDNFTFADSDSVTYGAVDGLTGIDFGTSPTATFSASGGTQILGATTNVGNINITAGTLRLGASNVIVDTASVNANSSVFDTNGFSETLGTFRGNGQVINSSPVAASALTLGANDASSGLIGGVISDGISLVKVGTGTLELLGANTFTGSTTVNDGTLVVSGAITSNVIVNAPGTLGGSGTINGSVGGDGTIAPGNSPGIMIINGDFTPAGTVAFEVNPPSATAGTDYDQIQVNGAVDLSGATLTFTGAASPPAVAPLQLVSLILNDGADATTPAADPVNGSVVLINGNSYRIFYNVGNNDVVLVEASAAATVYVDDSFTPTDGLAITDADAGTAGNQPAVYGINAFTTINAGVAGSTSGGTIVLNSGTYAEAASITGTRTLRLGGPDAAQDATVNSLASVAGTTIQLTGGSTLTVGDGTSTTIAGVISGGGNLTKVGAGTLALTGASTYGGSTTVNGGTLLVNGSITSAVDVNAGGTLGGNGSTGDVTVNAGGTITGGTLGAVGTLTVDALTFNGGTYAADFNGNNSDQIATAGAIDLGAGAAKGTFAKNSEVGTATGGTSFRLLIQTSGAAISNVPLNGAASLAADTINGAAGVYTYTGGNGNDFAFVATGAAALSGTGGDDNLYLRRVTTGGRDDFELLSGVVITRVGATILVAGGTVIDSRPNIAVTSYTVDGLGGNDQLVIDFANEATPGGLSERTIAFNGGLGTDGLFISGGAFGTIQYVYATPSVPTNGLDGSIQNYASAGSVGLIGTITYTGLEPLANTGTATDVVFDLPAGPNVATLIDDPTPASTLLRLDSTGTFETTDFAAPTGSLTINRGNAADTLDVGAITRFDAAANLNVGSAGNELAAVNFSGAASVTDLSVFGTTVTNTATADLAAAGNASFTGTTITLGTTAGDAMNFGTLSFAAGAVTIEEDSATDLAGTASATSLDLTAAGAITDAAGTTLTVTGNASFDAGANDITLGDSGTDTTNFGSLTVVGDDVAVTEDSATQFSGANTATTLTIDSAGAITNAAAASLAVTGNANYTGTSIDLGDQAGDAMNFGTLSFDAGAVAVAEDSATVLTGTASASSLVLTSAGSITDAAGTTLTVTGNASFNAGGNDITLGNAAADVTNLGSLTVFGDDVAVTEDSDTQFSGSSTATTLIIDSAGAITNAAAASVAVANNANFIGTSIDLGGQAGDAMNFGSLSFTAGAVTIEEDSATVLAGMASATSLDLTAAGTITDAPATILTVTGNASFDAGANDITLGTSAGDAINFGSLTVVGDDVAIEEDSDSEFAGVSLVSSLSLISTGAITNAAAASLTVAGATSFTGTSVNLGNQAGDAMNFGNVGANAGVGIVNINEDSPMAVNLMTGGSVTLSAAGAISDNNGAGTNNVTATDLVLTATGGTIDLDTATDTLALTAAGSAVIREADAVVLDGITVASAGTDTFDLTAGGVVTQTDSITADEFRLEVTAGGATLTDGANNVGTLAANVTGDLFYTDADALLIGTVGGTSGITTTGNDLTLDAGGVLTIGSGAGEDITAAGATVDITAAGATEAAGSIITSANLVLQGTGTFTLTEANDVDTLAANVTGALSYTDADALLVGTVNGTAGITTNGNDLTLIASGLLTIGDGAGQDVTAVGATVDITAAGATEAAGSIITAANLRLQGTGTFTLTQANDADVLAASVIGDLSFADADTLLVGTVNGTAGINTTGNDVTLNAGGLLTIGSGAGQDITATGATVDLTGAGATEAAGSIITAANLVVRGTGLFTLTEANDVDVLAANVTGDLLYTDADALLVGTVNGAAGITTNSNDLTMIASGFLTIGDGAGQDITAAASTVNITAAGALEAAGSIITTANLVLDGTGAFSLEEANDADVLAADPVGVLSYTDADELLVGTVLGTAGITTTGNDLTLDVGGLLTIGSGAGQDITATGATVDITAAGATEAADSIITSANLVVRGTGTFTLAEANDTDVLGADVTGDLAFTDVDALIIGTVNGAAGITTNANDATLVTGGLLTIGSGAGQDITATGAIVDIASAGAVEAAGSIIGSGQLRLTGAGAFTLDQANLVGTLAANVTGVMSYVDADALTVGTVNGTAGLTTNGNALTLNAGGLLTIGTGAGQAITAAGSALNLTAAGATEAAGSTATAATIRLFGTGAFTLEQDNDATVDFGATVTGPLSFRDATDLVLPDVVNAVATGGGALRLEAGQNFTANSTDPNRVLVNAGAIVIVPGDNSADSKAYSFVYNAEIMGTSATFGVDTAVDANANKTSNAFDVTPSRNVEITVFGNNPTQLDLGPGVPGDTVTPDLSRLTIANVDLTFGGAPADVLSGTFTVQVSGEGAPRKLHFRQIESLGGVGFRGIVVQTGERQYAIRIQRNVLGSGQAKLEGQALQPNPFVVTPSVVSEVTAYSAPRIAFGDLNGDGLPELVIANGSGDDPLVTVLDGGKLFQGAAIDLSNPAPGVVLSKFYAISDPNSGHPIFRGGLNVAVRNAANGYGDIVIGAGLNGGPRIQTWTINRDPVTGLPSASPITGLNTFREVASFFAFEESQRGGVNVATGDYNGDGTEDIIVGAGPGGGPRVQVFGAGNVNNVLANFFAYSPDFRGGVQVAAGNFDGDDKADIATAPGFGGGPHIRVLKGGTFAPAELASFFAWDPNAPNGLQALGSNLTNGVGSISFGGPEFLAKNVPDPSGRQELLVSSARGTPLQMRRFTFVAGASTPRQTFAAPRNLYFEMTTPGASDEFGVIFDGIPIRDPFDANRILLENDLLAGGSVAGELI